MVGTYIGLIYGRLQYLLLYMVGTSNQSDPGMAIDWSQPWSKYVKIGWGYPTINGIPFALDLKKH